MAELNFDATQVEPTSEFEILPDGDYPAVLIDSEWKGTKSGGGRYLQLTWEVLDGEFKGRLLWDRLNLENKNDTAVKIAQASLSAVCRAVGVLRPKDSAELHNKPCTIKVVVEERNDRPGVFKNEIRNYAPIGTATARPTVSGNNKMPWKK